MSARPEDQDELAELLIRWEELREQGEDADADTLCASCPGLAGELRRRIEALRDVASLIGGFQTDDGASVDYPGTVPVTDRGGERGAMRRKASCGAEYHDLEFFAAGGLGEIYTARGDDLNRNVAMKFIKRTRSHEPESRRRFLLEAEVTGRLEHPGIVPVYGLGSDDDGQPCYAMRLIRGESLMEAIEAYHGTDVPPTADRSWNLRSLLRRFVSVCNTVAYAHSRGMLHRDIKPRNILLGKYEETLLVDWGLARPIARAGAAAAGLPPEIFGEEALTLSSGDSGSTSPTIGIVGTPQYMSPEQADGIPASPASDVYSLGATFYTILVGRSAFSNRKPGEVLDFVRKGEYPRPGRVVAGVPPALEAICLKAMAREPEERYTSALELAAEVDRWLADDPVIAYPEPWLRRLGRWTRRHRTTVTGAAAAVSVAAVSFAVATGLLASANERVRKALDLANDNAAQAASERDTANANFRLATSTVDRYFTRISQDRLLNVPGLQPLRRELLDEARTFYQKFIEERDADPSVRAELGRAYLRLSSLTSDIGSMTEAVDLAKKGFTIIEELNKAQAGKPRFRADLAGIYTDLGRRHLALRQYEPAEAEFASAIKLWSEITVDQPNDSQALLGLAKTRSLLGFMQQQSDRYKESREAQLAARQAIDALAAARPDEYEVREAQSWIEGHFGQFFIAVGENRPAEEALKRSLAALDALLPKFNDDLRIRNARAETLALLGELYQQLSRVGDAERVLGEAITTVDRMVLENSRVVSYGRVLARLHIMLGAAYLQRGERRQALRQKQEAVDILDKLAGQQSDVPDLQNELAVALDGVAEVQFGGGQFEKAREANRRSGEIRLRLAKQHTDAGKFRQTLDMVAHNQALYSEPAAPDVSRGLDAVKKRAAEHPENVKYLFELAWRLNTLGATEQIARRMTEAEAAYTESVKRWEELARIEPDVPIVSGEIAKTQTNLAGLYIQAQKFDRASSLLTETIGRLEPLTHDHPQIIQFAISLASVHDMLGTIARAKADVPGAIASYDRSVKSLDAVLVADPENAKAARFRRTSRYNIATLHALTGDHRAAREELGRLAANSGSYAPDELYNLACGFSIASAATAADNKLAPGERKAAVDACATKAITLLEAARTAGFFRLPGVVEHMQADSDLAPIRGRDDFKAFVGSFKPAAPKP